MSTFIQCRSAHSRFWEENLFSLLCLNVFMAFYCRNLKPEARRAVTMLHVGKLISTELMREIRGPPRASA